MYLNITTKNYLKIPIGYFYKKDSKSETLSFAAASRKYLRKTRLDNRYYVLSLFFLEKPKTLRHQERITNRIITKQDIENILAHIETAESDG